MSNVKAYYIHENNNVRIVHRKASTSVRDPPSPPRKRTLNDVIRHLQNQTATKKKNFLIRVDFNVPMAYEKDGRSRITDDSRIRAALPTIKAVMDANFNAILVSHMGRPALVQKNIENDEARLQKKRLSLRPAAARLAELLECEIGFGPDCIGAPAKDAVATLPKGGGGCIVLENLRFRTGEESNEENFARSLASLADAFINDAFGTSHRAHASVTGVPKFLPNEVCGLGCLVSSEIEFLDFKSTRYGVSSVMAVIGGSKVSTKLPVIRGVLSQVDVLVLGGGLAFTFIKAKGIPVSNSLVEDSMLETAKDLMNMAEREGKQIVLPVDAVCGQEFPSGPISISDTKTFELVDGAGIDDGWSGFDIGPKSVELIRNSLQGATKVVFNGPMGVFEIPPYDGGTRGLVNILEDLTKQGTVTVVGGGDSVAALEAFKQVDVVSYISTGGGATLELMAGNELPGVTAISNFEAETIDNKKRCACSLM